MSMTEKEKMLAGEIYSAVDLQLLDELAAAREMIHDYNLLRPSENEKKLELLKGLLGHIADESISHSIATMASKSAWACGSLRTSTSPYSMKHESLSATTASLARTSASTRPVTALTL